MFNETNKNLQNINSKMEVTIMNIFKTKVKQIKVIYTKVADITILGQKFELKVAYKNVKVTELNFENREVKIILPLKYKNKDIRKILNVILNKMYEQIAKKEVESIMEKIRSKLKFAPEDYKIAVMKNVMAKCNSSREIIEYVVAHEFCHLKYKTHGKRFFEIIEKHIPEYQKYEREIQNYEY